MWLTSSSIGRKLVMALTGACLVLFVTFHCVMNAICICWPTAYNSICEFLGANWYALLASIGLAVLFILHIVYACWLTLQNRKARGNVRYSIEKRPAGVEWSSKNMLVLGIVILAFLVVHLIQFWAKMQLQEIRGTVEVIPAAAGTLFIQEAFSLVATPIIYIIGFVALWFHMNHGFWSMFESAGWTNNTWIPRLKTTGCWWTTIVVGLFIAQAIVFTVRAHKDYYKTDDRLRAQYQELVGAMVERDFGPDASQIVPQGDINVVYQRLGAQMENIEMQGGFPSFEKFAANAPNYDEFKNDPQFQMQFPHVKNAADWNKEVRNVYDKQKKSFDLLKNVYTFYGYLLGNNPAECKNACNNAIQDAPVAPEQVVVEEEQVEAVVADTVPADDSNN